MVDLHGQESLVGRNVRFRVAWKSGIVNEYFVPKRVNMYVSSRTIVSLGCSVYVVGCFLVRKSEFLINNLAVHIL